jgi:methionine-gamma-lyase
MKPFDPATRVQDYLVFGEFGDVNPSITDSSTYTFLRPETMEEVFEHEIEGCFLYSRHWNPTNKVLADALARMEDGEGAVVTSSGMAAISTTLMLLCSSGDDIVASRTIYGGSYALMKNLLPRFGITTRFVDTTDLQAVRRAIGPHTKALYCESISNPLLEVNDIPQLSVIAKEHGIPLVVDNTFSPMIISPLRLGADVVVHSMTKFINGTSDCVAGCVIGSHATVAGLMDINRGPAMLFGPTLDAFRAASILKNIHSLHVRLRKHSENALELARHMVKEGLKVYYPGLPDHPRHALLRSLMNPGYGYGGMLVLDAGTAKAANQLMVRMQQEKVGYLAVSLGYFKTLFSSPGHSTSSEIPVEEQARMGLSDGLVRFSVGLDQNIERTWRTIQRCMKEATPA